MARSNLSGEPSKQSVATGSRSRVGSLCLGVGPGKSVELAL